MWTKVLKTSVVIAFIRLLCLAFTMPVVHILPSAMTFSLTTLLLIELFWYADINLREYVHLAASLTLAYTTLAPSLDGVMLSATLFYLVM